MFAGFFVLQEGLRMQSGVRLTKTLSPGSPASLTLTPSLEKPDMTTTGEGG